MSLSNINCRALHGIDSPAVEVETHIGNGLPSFTIVGLPEKAVKESKDRVRSAIINSLFEFPNRKITVNLSPADLPKIGSRFDLAIAVGILSASGQIKQSLSDYEFIGELGLGGQIKSVNGILSSANQCKKQDNTLITCSKNAQQAKLALNKNVYCADHLTQIGDFFNQNIPLNEPEQQSDQPEAHQLCLSQVKGQQSGKRALEICAAGSHSMILYGEPGCGKTLLAKRLPSILPKLTKEQGLEVAAIQSITNQTVQPHIRPFRNPHHSTSAIALVGGGTYPKPGEITLAHHGVLFLDELTEFSRHTLDHLREPIEAGEITISRANQQTTFPSQFQLIGALNPSIEGGIKGVSGDAILKNLSKLSGPFMDRIDMQIHISPIAAHTLSQLPKGETSFEVQKRVSDAFGIQQKRQQCANALLSTSQIEQFCTLDVEQQQLMEKAVNHFGLSARSYHRILKVARTIADLDNSTNIQQSHLREALGYRQLERLIKQLQK